MEIGMSGMERDFHNDLPSTRSVGGNGQVARASRASDAGGDLASASVESSTGDRVHLSSAASLAAQAATLPEVRMGKVAAMQSAIANGYQVSATDVANALISHAQQE